MLICVASGEDQLCLEHVGSWKSCMKPRWRRAVAALWLLHENPCSVSCCCWGSITSSSPLGVKQVVFVWVSSICCSGNSPPVLSLPLLPDDQRQTTESKHVEKPDLTGIYLHISFTAYSVRLLLTVCTLVCSVRLALTRYSWWTCWVNV